MPAEFNTDPSALASFPASPAGSQGKIEVDTNAAGGQLTREYETAPRTDVIEIPLTDFLEKPKGSGSIQSRDETGRDLIYEWEAVGAKNPANDIGFGFHGHNARTRAGNDGRLLGLPRPLQMAPSPRPSTAFRAGSSRVQRWRRCASA